MRLAQPLWLMLALLIVAVWSFRKNHKHRSTILFSDVAAIKKIASKKTALLSKLANIIRYILLILMLITLAQPQSLDVEQDHHSEGIDIMLVIDTSRSMAAEDFKPDNRLTVAKERLKDFVSKRNSDRIGLVVFGGDAYTQSPLSLDYRVLLNMVDNIRLDMAGDGTSIGMAIATALNRMKDSKQKSKIIVLLTDGENNRGQIDPLSAARLAKDMNIKIYTIGIGKKGGAAIPFYDDVYGKVYARDEAGNIVLTRLDEQTLTEIARLTKGYFFRAYDEKGLASIYDQINQLEASDIKSKRYINYKDWFPSLLWIIFILLILEGLTRHIYLLIAP